MLYKEVEAATIFAPTDAAFAKLPKGILKRLTTAQKRAIISRHVIGGTGVQYKLFMISFLKSSINP